MKITPCDNRAILAPCTLENYSFQLSMLEKSDQNWQHLADIFQRHFPDLKKEIEAVLFSEDHAYWPALREELQQIQEDQGVDLSIHV